MFCEKFFFIFSRTTHTITTLLFNLAYEHRENIEYHSDMFCTDQCTILLSEYTYKYMSIISFQPICNIHIHFHAMLVLNIIFFLYF